MSLYLSHFGLNETPFRITPHTDFFFSGAERGTTLDALLYAILHEEGIVKVSGEVGSGKTMLCRVLIERLPEQVDVVYLATAALAPEEILFAIADDLKITLSQRRNAAVLKELQDHLIELYASGRRVVVLIDEAHAMPAATLEQVRLLSNLESSRHKLLQLVMFGQPELDQALADASLRQLKDRITHSFRMRPLSASEVSRYLDFRLRAAGYRGPELFSGRALATIARVSGGLTRRINILADKSLLAAFMHNAHRVESKHVRAAVQDSEFASTRPRRPVPAAAAALLAGLAGIAIGLGAQWLVIDEAAREPAREPAQQEAARPPAAEPPGASAAPIEMAAPLEAAQAVAATEPEAKPEWSGPRLRPEQAQRLSAYSPGSAKLLRSRLEATRELLDSQPDDRHSIVFFVSENPDPARMERFLIRARDMVPLEDLYVVPIPGPRYRLRVVYGSYSDKDAAAEAARRLPPKYQRAFEIELLSFSQLRGEI